MLFDVAAWVVILLVAWAVGGGALSLLRVQGLRAGDAFVIRAWIGEALWHAATTSVRVPAPATAGVQ